MPVLHIAGVAVDFPKSPYPCQVAYMDHVIRALKSGSNAMLESPTGTGKTLCLLCSTLAWQNSMKANIGQTLSYSPGPSAKGGAASTQGGTNSAPFTIVYATRTHSQLAQVVSELRETSYRPRMTVLGSREQLCVHEKISKLKSGVINHACNSLNSKRGCMYRNNLESYMDSSASMDNTALLDIEEMVKLGNYRKICPYFHSREFSTSSDLILLPYNYLLDGSIRKTLKLDWEKCIVIFDEAHNLERVAADAASFSLSSTDIALCIQELQQVLRTLKEEEEQKALSKYSSKDEDTNPLRAMVADSKGHIISNNTQSLTGSSVSSGVQKPSLATAVALLRAMFDLEKRVDQLAMPTQQNKYDTNNGNSNSTGNSNFIGSSGRGGGGGGGGGGGVSSLPGLVHDGIWLLQLVLAAGFSSEHCIDELRKCGNMLLEAAQDALETDGAASVASAGGGANSSSSSIEPKLNAFTLALERVFRSARSGATGDYRVYICDEEVKQQSAFYGGRNSSQTPYKTNNRSNNSGGGGGGGGGGGANKYSYVSATSAATSSTEKQWKRVINYWCFSTGVAMTELQKLGVKSLLLTSGTLSPMTALKDDIKLPFPHQLENPHVISDKQIWVGVTSTGPNGHALNSSFQSRDTAKYKDELGQAILQICLTMVNKSNANQLQSTTDNSNYYNQNRNQNQNQNDQSIASFDRGWAAYGVSSTNIHSAVATTTEVKAGGATSTGPVVRGGVLIFFPSYSVMERICSHWKDTGIYDKLRNHVGQILVEPRGSAGAAGNASTSASGGHAKNTNNTRGSFGNKSGFRDNSDSNSSATTNNFMMTGAVRAVNPKKKKKEEENQQAGEGGDDLQNAEFRGIVAQFEAAIQSYGGCILLAVCRGKVSEGIDFADQKGRVVIVTGIPFAPYMDPWVVLKKHHLDDTLSKQQQQQQQTHAGGTNKKSTAALRGLPGSGGISADAAMIAAIAAPVPASIGFQPAQAHLPTAANTASNPARFVSASDMLNSLMGNAPPSPPNNNTNSSTSTFHRTKTASAYPCVMPQAAIAGTVQQGAAQHMDQGVALDLFNHSEGKQASSAGSAGTGGRKGGGTGGGGGLSGQSWYSQTAGRAVNQCIGRVIRHNKDWGTVFLMDDRFMHDRQLSQLSRWLRPKVRKYTKFSAALEGFRSFITTAALDKELVPKKNRLEQAPVIRNRNSGNNNSQKTDNDNPFKRSIEIDSNLLSDPTSSNNNNSHFGSVYDLEDGEEDAAIVAVGTDGAHEQEEEVNTFINPSLLLTQQSVSSTTTQNNGESHQKPGGTSYYVAPAPSTTVSNGTRNGPTSSFMDIFKKQRNTGSGGSSTADLVPPPSSSSLSQRTAAMTATSTITGTAYEGNALVISYEEGHASRSSSNGSSSNDQGRHLEKTGDGGGGDSGSSSSYSQRMNAQPQFGLSAATSKNGGGPAEFRIPPPPPPPLPAAASQPAPAALFDLFNKRPKTSKGDKSGGLPVSNQQPQGKQKQVGPSLTQLSQQNAHRYSQAPPPPPRSSSSSSQFHPSTTSVATRPRSEGMMIDETRSEFQFQIGRLRELLPKNTLSEFKGKLQNACKASLRTVSQLKLFVDDIIPLLSSIDNELLKFEVLRSLSAMILPSGSVTAVELQGGYMQVVEQSVNMRQVRSMQQQQLRKGKGSRKHKLDKQSAADEVIELHDDDDDDEQGEHLASQQNVQEHIQTLLRDSRTLREDAEIAALAGSSGGVGSIFTQGDSPTNATTSSGLLNPKAESKPRSFASKRAKLMVHSCVAKQQMHRAGSTHQQQQPPQSGSARSAVRSSASTAPSAASSVLLSRAATAGMTAPSSKRSKPPQQFGLQGRSLSATSSSRSNSSSMNGNKYNLSNNYRSDVGATARAANQISRSLSSSAAAPSSSSSSSSSSAEATAQSKGPTMSLTVSRVPALTAVAASASARAGAASSSSSSSSTYSLLPAKKQLSCSVCKEKATMPCAGRCGHVCCQTCWVQWLKVKKSCPMCRAPADNQSVTRIIIK